MIPELNSAGDLPEGVHRATIDEVVARFGGGTPRRKDMAEQLLRIYRIANTTTKLDRLIVFGSFITSKPEPNDIDIVLIMRDDFDLSGCDEESRELFDHARAEKRFGASVFWIRPSMLILETLEEFIAHWQVKRDRTRRGIVEVKA